MILSTSEAAWAAGFVDGEGSIGVERRGERSNGARLVLTVVQKHPEPLQELRRLFGGYLDWQANQGRGKWRWRVQSRHAAEVLETIRPFLRVKGAEADVAIQFQRARGQGRATDPGLVKATREKLSELKRREVVSSVPVAA